MIQKIFKDKTNGEHLGSFRKGVGAVLLKLPTLIGNVEFLKDTSEEKDTPEGRVSANIINSNKPVSERVALHWIATSWGIPYSDILTIEEEII